MEVAPFLRGFGISFGLIAAIGAQNAYLLTRAILRNHHWVIALVCSILDAALITLGILGLGVVVESFPGLLKAFTIFGALFVWLYGLLAFKRAFASDQLHTGGTKVSLIVAISTVLSLSLLNPHVYLDTVVLIGSISLQEIEPHRIWFGVGAITASIVWFFALALCGQLMQGLFQSSLSWRILDIIVGIIMWSIAWMLVRNLL